MLRGVNKEQVIILFVTSISFIKKSVSDAVTLALVTLVFDYLDNCSLISETCCKIQYFFRFCRYYYC